MQYNFTPDQYHADIERARQRQLVKERIFVLLLGPSATGKSTIIQEMNTQKQDESFVYVKPVMTRPNRPNETDKTSVSDQVFDEMESRSEFVVVNNLYGVRYGTPLSGIINPLEVGKTPILDYPLGNVTALRHPQYDTLNFYVYPPSDDIWKSRMENAGRNASGRLEAGQHELGELAARGFRHPDVDFSVINHESRAHEAASFILATIDEVVL